MWYCLAASVGVQPSTKITSRRCDDSSILQWSQHSSQEWSLPVASLAVGTLSLRSKLMGQCFQSTVTIFNQIRNLFLITFQWTYRRLNFYIWISPRILMLSECSTAFRSVLTFTLMSTIDWWQKECVKWLHQLDWISVSGTAILDCIIQLCMVVWAKATPVVVKIINVPTWRTYSILSNIYKLKIIIVHII
jgi:hypothetical protein